MEGNNKRAHRMKPTNEKGYVRKKQIQDFSNQINVNNNQHQHHQANTLMKTETKRIVTMK